jgi:hypothetical protein
MLRHGLEVLPMHRLVRREVGDPPGATTYLLTVRGKVAAPTVADVRELHNTTAGAPQGIAAARSLGDLSHNVYSAVSDGSDTILLIDHWNSLTGLGRFFGDPQVQAGAGQLFAERDAVVWGPTSGFGNHHLAPVFAGEPQTSVWQWAQGEWIEW